MVKLAFIYEIADERYWRDGLWAALKILEKEWEIEYCNGRFPERRADFALVWGAMGSRQVIETIRLNIKKGVCVAGGSRSAQLSIFDVIFVETLWHQEMFKRIGITTKLAFGTNTQLFRPIPEQIKIWDAIYPAAFADWKRHEIFCQKYGGKGLAVGHMQESGWDINCYQICLEYGTPVLPMVTPDVLVWLYNASKKVHITADLYGGGERAVLEGLACGLPVEVEQDNSKLISLLAENKKRLWTEWDYAKALKEGIEQCLGKT
ncbi:MAG: hypothetical protein FJ044_01240 [Candidatus Cloacimonetes bacterium]|nr:hypothetical protein [Candidatus Cloacimonadota bacterium]